MPDTLFIGDRTYSSWSLRGWLLFSRFGLDVSLEHVDFNATGVAEQLAHLAPARTVPTLVTEDGAVLWDSLAIAEELATRHPDAGHWPQDPALRALARSLACEMHSGFGPLRTDCPMNLRVAYAGFAPSDSVRADLARLEEIWAHALEKSGGPWLAGSYSVADVFFAPVAGRIAGYGLEVSEVAQAYVARHLADGAFRRWRALGIARGDDLPWYAREFPRAPWPGPAPLAASAVTEGTPENASCPYSGKAVTHLLQMGDGRVFGFCNPICRDKTVADPEAWPAFMALL
jgi:glutathione S-transferase